MPSIYEQGIAKFNEEKYDEAIALFKQLSRESDEVMYAIATCYKMKRTFNDMLFSQKIYEKLLNKKIKDMKLKYHIKTNYVALITRLTSYYLDSDNKNGYDKALEITTTGLKIAPQDPILLYNMGHLYKCKGEFDTALKYLSMALDKNKTHLDCYHEIINIYMDRRDYPNSLKYIQMGIRNIPNCASLYNNLGLYYTYFDHDKSFETFNKALEYAKGDDKMLTKIHTNIGHLHSLIGDTANALEQFDVASKLSNDDMTPRQNFVMDSLYLVDMPYDTILQKHFETGLVLKNKHNKNITLPEHHNKKIHIGYVSGDFIGFHPMTYFMNALLNSYSTNNFELYCYNISESGDGNNYSPLIKWRHIKYMELSKCLELVLQDKIDILIDLSGHTYGNRLDIFANRVARLQLSYLGYPCVTGMPDIDYYLIDRTFEVNGCKTFPLPHCFTHYTPPFMPEKLIQPFKKNNFITFCSFNKPSKINLEVIKLWNRVLDAYPNSILIVKKNNNLIFSEKNKSRVRVIDMTAKYKDYVDQYNGVDIALDTFPYAGTTTTCECLLMGTPVITLADRTNKTIHQNTTASLLINSNLSNFVATSKDEYVSKIGDIINSIKEHENYKSVVQQKFLTGNVTNKTQYVQDFENIVTFLWKQKMEEHKQNFC
jgi:protein O-GlcNAc transferase